MANVRYPIEMVRGVPVVAVPAEIDVGNSDWLRAVLWEAAARGHGTFVVDMTGTQACASAGVSVLAQAHNWALAQGGELRLATSASAPVLRLFAVTGIDRVIPNFAGLDEALQPLSADPASPRPRRWPRNGMRHPMHRQPAEPGASTSPA